MTTSGYIKSGLNYQNLVNELFSSLCRKNILWAVLRNWEQLPEFVNGDIDILVAFNDFKKIDAIIDSIVETQSWIVIATVKRYEYKGYILVNKREHNDFLQIDFFTTCRYRHSIFADSKIGLQNRREVGQNIWAVPNGFETAVTAVKELAHNNKLKVKSLKRLKQEVNDDIDSFNQALKPYLGKDLTSKLQDNLRKGFWQEAEALAEDIRKSINILSLSNIIRQAPFWVKTFTYHLNPPLSFFVVLIAPDGSGKTTVAKGIGDKLLRNPFSGYEHLHFSFEILPKLKSIKKILSFLPGLKFKDLDKEDAAPGTLHMGMAKPHGILRSMTYAAYYTLDFFLGRLILHRFFGQQKLVIFDRYFYDYYYQLGYSQVPHLFLNFLEFFIPKPHLIIYLSRDANEIYAVKPELTVAEIQREQQIIKSNLLTRKNTFLIDAEKGIEATIEDVSNLIVEHLVKK